MGSSGTTQVSRVLDREALEREPLDAARVVVGATLVRDDAGGYRSGRIVEVEAYGGAEDRASHARFGRTARNAVMFGPAGIAYVYLVYGMYDCLNVVTGLEGTAGAVLIRAVAPTAGLEPLRRDRERAATVRRRTVRPASDATATIPDPRLASGPGLVGAAFGLDRGWTGVDLCDPRSPLRLERGLEPVAHVIVASPRIGVAYAGEPWSTAAWRLAIEGHPSVSGRRSIR